MYFLICSGVGDGGAEIVGLLFDEREHLCRVVGVHLRAVLAVNFIAVVLFGIVLGGYHNARNRL